MTNKANVTIVIDVFRAFSTACHILNHNPSQYFFAPYCHTADHLHHIYPNAILIGKPEIGSTLRYHAPNSPQRSRALSLESQVVIHRTQAGATGVIDALTRPNELVLACGFTNALATAHLLQRLEIDQLTIRAMGHEATSPSIEDDVCADYLQALIDNAPFDPTRHFDAIKKSSGAYFFSDDQAQYPKEDFEHCLSLNTFDFAIQAQSHGDYATLSRYQPTLQTQQPHHFAQSDRA